MCYECKYLLSSSSLGGCLFTRILSTSLFIILFVCQYMIDKQLKYPPLTLGAAFNVPAEGNTLKKSCTLV